MFQLHLFPATLHPGVSDMGKQAFPGVIYLCEKYTIIHKNGI